MIVSLKRPLTSYIIGPLRMIWAKKGSRAGLIILVGFLALILVGPLALPPPVINPSRSYKLPSLAYPLGTDASGQNIFSEIIYGGQFILILSLIAALISTGVGTVVGLTSGFIGGKVDKSITVVVDIAITIPGLILIIVLSRFVKATDPISIGVLLSLVGWATFARVIRSQVLVLRKQPFVEAAKMLHLSRRRVIFVELLPNVMPYVAVNFIFSAEVALFASVGLYYLGLLPYNALNWGTMINQAFTQGSYLSLAGVSSLISPLAAVTIFSVGLILLAGGLEEVFNPRLRTS